MADYRDWCYKCGAEKNFGSHEPWCGKMTPEEWKKKQFEEHFQELELNVLTVDTLYECKRCFAVTRSPEKHLELHDSKYFRYSRCH